MKKQQKKDTKSTTLQAAAKAGQNYLVSQKRKILSFMQKAKIFIGGIPQWIQSRPQAFRAWRIADKKKKKYRSFRLQKRIKPEPRYVPPTGQLFKETLKMFVKNFWVFVLIMFVHACLYYVFVRGGSSFDLKQIQESIRLILGGNDTASSLALVGAVLGSNQQREGSGIYNLLILVFISLAHIWAIRRIQAGKKFYIREAFYQGFAPVVPFLLILVVMTLQSLPFTVTSYVYITGRTNNLFISGVEDLSFFLIALFCGLLSIYWMTNSIISLYAVTLPNMYPLKTLRLTKKITAFRRFLVFRRIIAFPVVIGLFSAAVLLLAVRFVPQYSPLLVEAFPILLLPILHGYYFKLYRSLI